MSDDNHSDAIMRHFSSRSQQPKLSTAVSNTISNTKIIKPANMFTVFDQGFGNSTSQIDDTRFKNKGTVPASTRDEKINSRRVNQTSMRESFNW